MDEQTVNVKGPFYFRKEPSVFECEFANEQGVYLWSVKTEPGELIYYVGESNKFARRLKEHLRWYETGWSQFHEPAGFAKGIKRNVWPGAWRKKDRWRLKDFEERRDELIPILDQAIDLLRLWLIPLDVDRRMRERLEGEIATYLRSLPSPIGNFQESDIRYKRKSADEKPVEYTIKGWEKFRGLPESIRA